MLIFIHEFWDQYYVFGGVQCVVRVHGGTEAADDLSVWVVQLYRCTRHAYCFCIQLHSLHLQLVVSQFINCRDFIGHKVEWIKWNNYYTTGRAKKSNPLGKIRYLWNGSKFFHQINKAYRGGFRPHTLQISLPYLLAFQNYHYLNLNVHFSKWTSN